MCHICYKSGTSWQEPDNSKATTDRMWLHFWFAFLCLHEFCACLSACLSVNFSLTQMCEHPCQHVSQTAACSWADCIIGGQAATLTWACKGILVKGGSRFLGLPNLSSTFSIFCKLKWRPSPHVRVLRCLFTQQTLFSHGQQLRFKFWFMLMPGPQWPEMGGVLIWACTSFGLR